MMRVRDIYDGTDWTDSQIEDLRRALECSESTIEEIAVLLYRAWTVDEVRAKAQELGFDPDNLAPGSRQERALGTLPRSLPTRTASTLSDPAGNGCGNSFSSFDK